MFLRDLAKELYRCQKEVEKLEKIYNEASTLDKKEAELNYKRAVNELEITKKTMHGRKKQSLDSLHKRKFF